MVNMIDMSVGMLIGMILSPVMMKATKKLYHQYRVNNILKNLVKQKFNEREKEENDRGETFRIS